MIDWLKSLDVVQWTALGTVAQAVVTFLLVAVGFWQIRINRLREQIMEDFGNM